METREMEWRRGKERVGGRTNVLLVVRVGGCCSWNGLASLDGDCVRGAEDRQAGLGPLLSLRRPKVKVVPGGLGGVPIA